VAYINFFLFRQSMICFYCFIGNMERESVIFVNAASSI
jgi:hypothetical protein